MKRNVLFSRLTASLRSVFSIRLLYILCCTSCTVSLLWLQYVKHTNLSIINENLVQEALENVGKDSRYTDVYRKLDRLPNSTKYILLWTRSDFAPFYFFEKGQRAFINNNCPVTDCYVTNDKSFFSGDITRFDAIAFNARNIKSKILPKVRSPRQKYVFFSTESADYYPMCPSTFDNFFNWTATYRLDSDIPLPYIKIRDLRGKVIGPKINMDWATDMIDIDEDLASSLQNKTKAAAWFVSNCYSRSSRKKFASKLQKALAKYNLTIDVYGACGPLKCPKKKQMDCDSLLQSDYYFYLALENSFAEDYVTEKLLMGLKHGAVPIVYGGANYSRFLPPGSYIDGRNYTPEKLASLMNSIIKSPAKYHEYFKWRNYYKYSSPLKTENVCGLCVALHNEQLLNTTSVYKDFRKWWNPLYPKRCTILSKKIRKNTLK